MDSRKALDGQAMAIMVVLCLIWGLQQVVLKAAAADVTPLMQIAMRTGIAAVLVGLLMARRGERIRLADGTWRPGLLVGFLFALEFLLVGEGLRFTSASHMVVFLYTAPIFVALGLHWKLPAERLAAIQWFGVALAFGGIVIAFFGRGRPAGDLAAMLWGDLLALGAGIAWAATTVAVRLSSLAREPATKTLFYQLAVGFVLLMLAAIVLGQTGFKPTPLAWGSLLFQALVVSFASYLAWFWLLRQYLASRLGVFSFLTPLFGVAFGVWLLDEPLEPSFLIGATLVCAGIILVSGYGWIRSLFGGER
ncbi:MAG: DMT family transporter [Rhodocyclaceae bacterium]|nr:DMT family transporter [Rhodocyclaceae bacterium]